MDQSGGVSYFLSNIFCLTVPQISIGKSFPVAFFSVSEKVWKGEGVGEYHDLPSKTLCLTVRKIILGESFTVALISGTEKIWRRGGHQDFP